MDQFKKTVPRFCILLVVLVLRFTTSINAQQYQNLIFEGAGIRGVAYVGAIKEMEQRGILPNIRIVGGTSAGAIAALMVSLGYSAKEIETIIYSMGLQKFNDGNFFFIGGISRLNRNYGWYKGKAFLRWLEKVIVQKTGDSEITFHQLHTQNFRDLYVTGTSLTNQKLVVFSYTNYPNMKIKDAVRISMSIPLYFEAVYIDSEGRVIDSKHADGSYDIMVDGGFTGNFPIFLFDSLINVKGQLSRQCNPYTIGLRIDSPEQIEYDLEQKGLAPAKINHFNDYVSAFYAYVIENLNRTELIPEDWKRTVSISSEGIGPKIKKLSVKEKDALINNDQLAMRLFLQ